MLKSCAVACVSLALAACAGSPAPPQQQAQTPVPSSSSSPSTPSYPPIPTDVAAARPMAVVDAVYRFAADHPEVLSHIPCFCGCEERGHRHNDDCFVAARDAGGRVTAWEPHGLG
jgi:uncharacterized protein with PCYCGC motif